MLVHETWWSKTKEKERIWSVKMVGGQGLIGLQRPRVTRLSSTTLSSKTNHESLLNICSPKVRTRDPKLMMSAWKLWVVRPKVVRKLWVVFFHLPLSLLRIKDSLTRRGEVTNQRLEVEDDKRQPEEEESKRSKTLKEVFPTKGRT